MTSIKRRHFLQFGSSALAGVFFSRQAIMRQGSLMAKGLAQDTSRKIALLVGINQYDNDASLKGCVSDVISQRELLIHRFGFNPQDILMVSDDSEIKPTRDNILQAFQTHLIDQVKPGDVAVFHFSGHGSRVLDPDSTSADKLSSTFVPSDGERKQSGGDILVNHITGRTLFLLMAGVDTNNLTVVLDSCHSGGGTRGNYRVRSVARSSSDVDRPAELELKYRRQLQAKANVSAADLDQEIPKGIILGATQPEQLAVDGTFDGFHAGVFSYVLTRYLWQMTEPRTVTTVFDQVAQQTTQISTKDQVPQFYLAGERGEEPTYFLPTTSPAGDGVIRTRNGSTVEMWLGGLSAFSLAAFNSGSQLIALDKQGNEVGEIQLSARDGLSAQGTICQESTAGAIASGTIIQEKVRSIPQDFRLKVGLDDSIDSNAAELANISNLERIEFKDLGTGAVDYILGRVTDQSLFKPLDGFETAPPLNSIGLYDAVMTPVPGSFDFAGEAITAAVKRLRAKFNGLLAARWLKLAVNGDTSRLFVRAEMIANGDRTVAQEFSVRGEKEATPEAETVVTDFQDDRTRLLKLPSGTDIRFKVHNLEERDLYLTILVIDATGDIGVVFPNIWSGEAGVNKLPAGQQRLIPGGGDTFELVVQEPLGATEVLILVSSSTMASSLKALNTSANSSGVIIGPQGLSETDSVAVVENLLRDASSQADSGGTACQIDTDSLLTETNNLVAFSLSFVATEAES
ncbi:MAG: caspase family protein [Pleurocapsa sp.]